VSRGARGDEPGHRSDLREPALEVSGEWTKKVLVTRALQEFVGRREQRRVVERFGTLGWDDAYDDKGERSRS